MVSPLGLFLAWPANLSMAMTIWGGQVGSVVHRSNVSNSKYKIVGTQEIRGRVVSTNYCSYSDSSSESEESEDLPSESVSGMLSLRPIISGAVGSGGTLVEAVVGGRDVA